MSSRSIGRITMPAEKLIDSSGPRPPKAGAGRAGGTRRELEGGAGRADVGRRIALLRQRRRAETGARGAADREGVGEIVARGELADPGVAEVAVVLVAAGEVDGPVLDRIGDEVDVERLRRALDRAGIALRIAGERLAALDVERTRIAGADGVRFVADLGTEGKRQRLGEADLELLADVDRADELVELEAAVVEVGRREAGGHVQRRIDRLGRVDVRDVFGISGGDVPVPAVSLTPDAAGERELVLLHLDVRDEADLRGVAEAARRIGGLRGAGCGPADAVRHPIALQRVAVAVGHVAERIDLEAVELVAEVEEAERQLRGGLAAVDVGRAVGIGQFLVDRRESRGDRRVAAAVEVDDRDLAVALRGPVVAAMEQRDVEEPGIAHREAEVAARAVGRALAVVVFPGGRLDVAARGVALEDDVDHAGDRVGAVLRRGAILQDLDPLDDFRRDQVEARRGGAAEGAVDHLEDRVAVAALAVDHHQRVIGAEAAQAAREREARHVGALRLRLERGDQLGQHLVEVGLADVGNRVFRKELDRRRGFFNAHAGGAGAGDDDRIGAGIVFGAGGSGCGWIVLRQCRSGQRRRRGERECKWLGETQHRRPPVCSRPLPFACPAIGLAAFPESVGRERRLPAGCG
jgi:hypothetical protein